MSSNRERVIIPINKSYFSTFMNNFLSITYLNDKTTSLESLKLLLFPIEFSDQDYLNLCICLKRICDESIKENKEKDEIEVMIKKTVEIEDEFSKIIISSIINKKVEIIDFLNSKFNDGYCNLKSFDWKIKSILASNRENYVNERFADLEFSINKSNNRDESLQKVNTKLITFNKSDISIIACKLSTLNENLKSIRNIVSNSGSN